MFRVNEATAAGIRQVFEGSGELSAAVELRRHFPGIKDNAAARRCLRMIVGWKPLPPLPPRAVQCSSTGSTESDLPHFGRRTKGLSRKRIPNPADV
jgi:hypothetical protein